MLMTFYEQDERTITFIFYLMIISKDNIFERMAFIQAMRLQIYLIAMSLVF